MGVVSPVFIVLVVLIVAVLWLVFAFVVGPVIAKNALYTRAALDFLSKNNKLHSLVGGEMKFDFLPIPGGLWGNIRNLKFRVSGLLGVRSVRLVMIAEPPLSENWKVRDAWIVSGDGSPRESL